MLQNKLDLLKSRFAGRLPAASDTTGTLPVKGSEPKEE
jgi:hypothetical protein